MKQTTLKTARLLIPGIASVIGAYYFYSVYSAKPLSDFEFKEWSLPTIFAVIIGVFYYLTDVRFLITNYSHKKIDLNIKEHLCKLYAEELSKEERQFLYQKNRLKSIFYQIIDNDESLKAKQQNVYFNGLIWTSTADLFIISFLFSLIFLCAIPLSKMTDNDLLIGGFFMLFIALISYGLHTLSWHKHIELSNDQIEFIETHHVNLVTDKIKEILND